MRNEPIICIVEDDLFFGSLVKKTLEQSAYNNVTLFQDPQLFLSQETLPDIVVLDHDLGSYKGLDILKAIKQKNPEIEVVYLTGQHRLNVAINSLKCGAAQYIEKNTKSLETLVQSIRTIIDSNDKYEQEVIEYKRKQIRSFLIALSPLFIGWISFLLILNYA